MKKYAYLGISITILIFGTIFFPRIKESLKEEDVVNSVKPRVKPKEVDSLVYIEQNGKNKKVPDFKFVNQYGDTVTHEDYIGKVYVVEYFFTTCPSICPVMNKNLKEVQEEFKDNSDFGIASFTIDPEHDTPDVLKNYITNNAIVGSNWNFLTGDRKRIYEMANNGFGIFANEDETVPGGFAHSGLFALIDKEGYLRSRVDEYGNPIIYYRGYIDSDSVGEGGETSQIDILIKDISTLL